MTFRDIEVLDLRPHFDSPSAGQLDDLTFAAGGFGLATPWRASGALRRTLTLPLLLRGLHAVAEWRRFIDRHRGRQKPFWMPAWINEFPILNETLTASDEQIEVEGTEFHTRWQLGLQHRYIFLATRSGTLQLYGVVGVELIDAGANTRLDLSRGLDTDLNPEELICGPLLLARFQEDEFQWEYLSGNVISTEMKVIECPAEYPGIDDEGTLLPTEAASALDSAHMGTRPVFLYRITDGVTTLLLADYGVDVSAAGLTWEAANIEHGTLRASSDMLGDSVEVTIRTDDPDHPLRVYLNEFNCPNFSVEIFAADMDALASVDLNAPEHIGRIEQVDFATEGQIRMQVSSLFRLNERKIPTMRMQRTCNWRTFEGGCGAIEEDFQTTGTISGISADPPYVEASAFGDKATAEGDPNWFALGKVTVGNERRLCTGQDGNRLYLNFPFVHAEVSDSITAVAGDDKRIGTCKIKFDQLVNHSGAPYIPNANPQIEPLKQPATTGGKKTA